MGGLLSTIGQCFPPKSKFSTSDIPDLTGKVVVVTGGYSGVGYEIAKAVLEHNAKVYLAVRDDTKAAEAISTLKEATGKEPIFLKVDLSSLASIKSAAEKFNSQESDLHILFNNAAVMFPPLEQISADGYDLQFGTNVLGHFYLTKLLTPALLSGAKSSPDGKARVVNTGSITQMIGKINPDTYRDGPVRRKQTREVLYAQSKLAAIVVAKEMARRFGDQGIVSTAVNPGNLRTPLQRHMGSIERAITRSICYDPQYGALTALYAGTSPETVDSNGKYFIPWAREGRPRSIASDPAVGEKMWTWLEEQVKDIQ